MRRGHADEVKVTGSNFEVPAGGSYRVVIDGATHETFSEDPIVIAALRAGTATSERRLPATVRQLTLAVVEATLGTAASSACHRFRESDQVLP
jgi:hypothetical protein